MSQAVQARSTVAELETLFGRFPHVPREIIVKIELLSRGFWFTEAALAATEKVARHLEHRSEHPEQHFRNARKIVQHPPEIAFTRRRNTQRRIMIELQTTAIDPTSEKTRD